MLTLNSNAASDSCDVLCCPKSGAVMRWHNGRYVSPMHADVQFPVEDGIIRAFLPNTGNGNDVTSVMKSFYEENPFPNYDEMESVGSLIEKSFARGFPEMLNRSIPPHSNVLEVGCGTGQLGNFLSIANRRILSVDMCWNSLRLAQQFKERNHLRNVTFAQMNLFRLPLQPASFDVVICSGVLHHTNDPLGGFRGFVPLVKPGGHIIVGLYNRYGRLKTRLRRILFAGVGKRFAMLDPYLRGFGVQGDKKQAWYMDQYRNPHESLHSMDEVLHWFENMGIDFVRALPSTVIGSEFELEYRQSLFSTESRGSRMDRLLSQCRQMLTDTEGGLFIMIGRKR